jgi:hypothetical protein
LLRKCINENNHDYIEFLEVPYNDFTGFDINLIPKDCAETAKVLCFLEKKYTETKNANKKIKKIRTMYKKLRSGFLSSNENKKFFSDNKAAVDAVVGGFYMKEMPNARLVFTFQIIANVMFYGKEPVFNSKYGKTLISSWQKITIDEKEKALHAVAGEAVKKEKKAIYKAYFSDGECSGPYIAIVSENDSAALEAAQHKLMQHIEHNGLDITEITVTQIEELNENQFFTINLNREEKKKNRYLLGKREC